jgi:hypothetical protein
MSSTDKSKLDGIAAGAQVNVATNLAQGTRTTTSVPITSSTGSSATLDVATTSLAGVMSSADKSKLDGIAAGANNYSLPATVFRNDATNSGSLRFAAANGLGVRFWDNDAFKIWMSSSTDGTWGGRLDSTSDYNMYFKFAGGGTNRGFVFQTNSGNVFQIEQSGSMRTAGTSLTASGAFDVVATGNNIITATTNGTERLRVAGDGNIGIGTTSPANKLHLVGAPVSVTGAGVLIVANAASATQATHIGLPNNSNPFLAAVNGGSPAYATYGWGFFDSTTDGSLEIKRKNNSTSWSDALKVFRSNGKLVTKDIGINITSNDGTVGSLDVQNSTGGAPTLALRTLAYDFSDLGQIVFYNNYDPEGEGAIGPMAQITAITGSSAYDGQLQFYLSDGTGSAQTLGLIKNKVGINTTDPIVELDVSSGDVRARGYLEKTATAAISSGTLTLNLSTARVFLVTLNANITTLTISNVPSTASSVVSFTLILTADGTARTVTWPASVKWPGGTAPTLTSTNTKKDVISFVSTDAGTTWLGFVGGQSY